MQSGLIRSLGRGWVIAFVWRSYRQGVSVQPLQMWRACGAAAAGEWAMELREEELGPRGSHLTLAAVIVSVFLHFLCSWAWEVFGALEPVWVCGVRRPSFCELAKMGLNVACQHQRGDQLLWLWQAKLKLSISALGSLLACLASPSRADGGHTSCQRSDSKSIALPSWDTRVFHFLKTICSSLTSSGSGRWAEATSFQSKGGWWQHKCHYSLPEGSVFSLPLTQ